jgi:photosystem II stability/assembly factor-like uncharacterized protein
LLGSFQRIRRKAATATLAERLISLGLCSILLFWIAGCSKRGLSSIPVEKTKLTSLEPEETDDPDARSDWFLFQRTYPADFIPLDARRAAWKRVLDLRERQQPQFESTASGPSWHSIGPTPTFPLFSNVGLCSGRINAIAVSPANSKIIIVGGATGGIWRSNDGGANFEPVTDNQVDLAVGSIAFSDSNPSIVYAGMGDTKVGYLGTGVLKSTDEGVTWTRINNDSLPSPGTIARITVDEGNPNRVYVAQYTRLEGNTISSAGIFVSTDGGTNWSRLLAGGGRDIVIDPAEPRTLYAGISRVDPTTDSPFGLYRSTDRGGTWSLAFAGPEYDTRQRRDIKIAISSARPQRVLAVLGGVLPSGLDVRFALSTDAGGTWAEQAAAGFDIGQFGYNSYIIADPRDADTLYLGTRDVYKSTDGGATWSNLTHSYSPSGGFYEYTPGVARAHADQHSFAFSPNNSNQLFIGNDGGIWRSGDGGLSFQSLNGSLSLGLFTGIAIHPTDRSISYGGTQDNGNQRRFQGTGSWVEFLGGDGGHTVINPVDPQNIFVTYVRGNIYRFFNDGDFFDAQLTFDSTFGELGTPRMAFYPPFVGNGTDSTLYFGTWRLFLSTDLGNSWAAPAGQTDLTKGLTTRGADVLSAIGVSRSDTRVIYTGSSMGRAMTTADAGLTWRDITPGLPDRSITSVTVDPTDPATAYLTLSGFGTSHVFWTNDSGVSWSDLSNGLPDIPVNAFLIDPVNPSTFYAGTDVGVFRSTNRGETWKDFNRGLPPVVIHEFSAQLSGLIQVATYGRGVYELQGNERPIILTATFDGKKKVNIVGTGFGDSPQVLINGQDRTGKVVSSSDTSLKLKGKTNKLGLTVGDNLIQVISNDSPSTPFVLRL